jgi:hypothetical protein
MHARPLQLAQPSDLTGKPSSMLPADSGQPAMVAALNEEVVDGRRRDGNLGRVSRGTTRSKAGSGAAGVSTRTDRWTALLGYAGLI